MVLSMLRKMLCLSVFSMVLSSFGWIADGGGLVAVHSASGMFGNSNAYIELIGGQFLSHDSGVFTTRITEPDHPIMLGFEPFESWDETYVHQRHNETNRTVLTYRENEPWTWVRTHGKGRVFYTAWGHNQRTFENPGFHELLERGIRWVAGQDVTAVLAQRDVNRPFFYMQREGKCSPYFLGKRC